MRYQILLAVLTVTLGGVSAAWGQGFGGNQTGSSAASSSFGGVSTGFGGLSGGGSFGAGSGSTFGSGSGFGNTGLGQSGFGQQQGLGAGQTLGQGGGQNQGFIGRDSGDVANALQSMNRNAGQFFNQVSRSLGQRGGQGGGAQPESNPPPVKVKLNVEFDHPIAAPANLPSPTTARLQEILQRRGLTNVRVAIADGQATLTGAVNKASEQRLVTALAKLEPGVRTVVNRTTVGPPAGELTLPPSASAPY